jgi:hypothetical protein
VGNGGGIYIGDGSTVGGNLIHKFVRSS